MFRRVAQLASAVPRPRAGGLERWSGQQQRHQNGGGRRSRAPSDVRKVVYGAGVFCGVLGLYVVSHIEQVPIRQVSMRVRVGGLSRACHCVHFSFVSFFLQQSVCICNYTCIYIYIEHIQYAIYIYIYIYICGARDCTTGNGTASEGASFTALRRTKWRWHMCKRKWSKVRWQLEVVGSRNHVPPLELCARPPPMGMGYMSVYIIDTLGSYVYERIDKHTCVW